MWELLLQIKWGAGTQCLVQLSLCRCLHQRKFLGAVGKFKKPETYSSCPPQSPVGCICIKVGQTWYILSVVKIMKKKCHYLPKSRRKIAAKIAKAILRKGGFLILFYRIVIATPVAVSCMWLSGRGAGGITYLLPKAAAVLILDKAKKEAKRWFVLFWGSPSLLSPGHVSLLANLAFLFSFP